MGIVLVDKNTIEYPELGLRVEADPEMVGPRGGVMGYRVVLLNVPGAEVYAAARMTACTAFCQGVAWSRGVEV